MEIKEGIKAKGFKFKDGADKVEYHPLMDKYVGVEGTISYIGSDYYTIQFGNVYCSYPLFLMPESFLSLGDKVKIPQTKSVGETITESGAIAAAQGKNQDYLYFNGMKYNWLMLNSNDNTGTGDYFSLTDIELY
jgi:hypothetical protein